MKTMNGKTGTRIPFFQRFICQIDWRLNKELKECLKYGIRKVTYDGSLFAEAQFGDLSTYEFWNVEKWEGWLKFGTFRNMWNQECYKYENKRPTRRTMRRFLAELGKHQETSILTRLGVETIIFN